MCKPGLDPIDCKSSFKLVSFLDNLISNPCSLKLLDKLISFRRIRRSQLWLWCVCSEWLWHPGELPTGPDQRPGGLQRGADQPGVSDRGLGHRELLKQSYRLFLITPDTGLATLTISRVGFTYQGQKILQKIRMLTENFDKIKVKRRLWTWTGTLADPHLITIM